MDKEKEYFIATSDDSDGKPVIYQSEKFKLSEIDLINLIKICLIEQRSKGIGNKLKDIYLDSTQHRIEITQERLSKIGLKDNGNNNPVKFSRTKIK